MSADNASSLAGQVALITGGGTGIGAAIARQLVEHGVTVVLTGRRQAPLDDTAQQLTELFPSPTVYTLTGDVTCPDTCKTWVSETVQRYGRLDILVNNAGVCGKLALLQEVPAADIHAMVDTNLKGPIFLTQQALAQAFVPQQSGTVLNINSIAGKSPFPYWAVYSATKAGLDSLAKALQEEHRHNNVRVLNLYPGAVATPLWEPLDATYVPSDKDMLTADQVADAAVLALKQPANCAISEVTMAALQPPR